MHYTSLEIPKTFHLSFYLISFSIVSFPTSCISVKLRGTSRNFIFKGFVIQAFIFRERKKEKRYITLLLKKPSKRLTFKKKTLKKTNFLRKKTKINWTYSIFLRMKQGFRWYFRNLYESYAWKFLNLSFEKIYIVKHLVQSLKFLKDHRYSLYFINFNNQNSIKITFSFHFFFKWKKIEIWYLLEIKFVIVNMLHIKWLAFLIIL